MGCTFEGGDLVCAWLRSGIDYIAAVGAGLTPGATPTLLLLRRDLARYAGVTLSGYTSRSTPVKPSTMKMRTKKTNETPRDPRSPNPQSDSVKFPSPTILSSYTENTTIAQNAATSEQIPQTSFSVGSRSPIPHNEFPHTTASTATAETMPPNIPIMENALAERHLC